MTFTRLAACATGLSLLMACETTVPDVDTSPPRLFAYSVSPSEIELMATTDPRSVADLETGCPTGTSATVADIQAYVDTTYGDAITYTPDIAANAYYTDDEPPYAFWLISRDSGGVFSMRAIAYADWERLDPQFDFGSDDRETNHDAFSLDDSGTYGFNSSIRSHGDVPIFIYDKRPGGVGGEASMPGDTAIDGLTLQIQPSGLGVASHFYVESIDVTGNRTQLVVHVLPASLCR